MRQLKNYDPNEIWGKHLIKVTFQHWAYTACVVLGLNGNANGMGVLYVDEDKLYDLAESKTFIENAAQLKDIGEDWFRMVLKNEDGEELIVEDEWDGIEGMITGVEIVGFEKE